MITNSEGKVTQAKLYGGEIIEADLVLLGTDQKPNTDFLRGQVEIGSSGGVVCDPFLKTSAQNVFCAGGIANYPYWRNGQRLRSNFWS